MSDKVALVLSVLLVASPVLAQESLTTVNPLAALKDELSYVLAEADVPFSDGQERSIVLMMEERRQASEALFGDLMDFRGGPTTAQETERLQSAIEWLRQEFLTRIQHHLTAEQLAIWSEREAAVIEGHPNGNGQGSTGQTQYVRINSNTFTSESSSFSRNAGGGTEVIQRGGAGLWHGNAQVLLQDEALNARNAFAANKPPYQERQIGVDAGGPLIRDRLTATVSASQNESEDVDTIRATLPDGLFALGITRPTVNRSLGTRATYQLASAHTMRANVFYRTETRENQGIGGFNLPERASHSSGRMWNVDVRQFSQLGSGGLYETSVRTRLWRSETIPLSEDVRINVLDAFHGGGAQNRSESTSAEYGFSNMYTRTGRLVTLKMGMDARYQANRSVSTSNFGGTYTFSSLDAYVAGEPLTYRVTQGDPALDVRQLEAAGFVQTDLPLTSQFTLMLGMRYDGQTNLRDRSKFSPRLGFAYGLGPSTVLRGGGGLYYDRLNISQVENQRRLDGTRQFEIAIDAPAYPDPAGGGTVRQTFPSVRVTDPDLRAPYTIVGMLSVERTVWRNLLVTAMYDFQRGVHGFRLRNLNAPYDATAPVPRACQPDRPADTCVRPDPTRGNVENLESTGFEVGHNLRLSARQRFSIFNVSGTYTFQRVFGDSPGVRLPMDSYDPRADWGRAPNPSHNVSTTINARLPLGVFLTNRMSANSGRYYTITTGRDDNRDTVANDRPPGVPPNSERGPRYVNFDFNISKAIFIGGGMRNVNVFANVSNAFNRVHYGTPSGVMTSPNFGRSTSAQDPRTIEIGVRAQF
jgi:hypothetical protein